jgi:simple sugar transport system ATP-binding protein
VGVVYQEFRLIDHLSVAENVLLGTGQRPSRAAFMRVAALARQAGFDVPVAAPVRQLGISHRQQVEILKLLVRDLDVLIFDEPTAVLGEAQVGELFSALRALKAQGKAVIIITHRLREVRAIADRLTVLREGRVRALDRRPDELTDAELTMLMVGEAVRKPGEDRLDVSENRPVRLSLDDVHVRADSGSGVRGVSLRLRAGEILGVAGIRGNGQKEMAELAAGLCVPDQGKVERAPGAVAFIPEDRLGQGLSRRMSIAENLALRRYAAPPLGRPYHLGAGRMAAFARGLIGQYEIPAQGEWQVTRLSGGNLQRVVIARELERGAHLIVAAQPSRGLDVRSAAFVHLQLIQAAAAGAGILVVSEDLDELMTLTDRIMVLYEGRVAAELARQQFDRQQLGALMVGGAGQKDAA